MRANILVRESTQKKVHICFNIWGKSSRKYLGRKEDREEGNICVVVGSTEEVIVLGHFLSGGIVHKYQ